MVRYLTRDDILIICAEYIKKFYSSKEPIDKFNIINPHSLFHIIDQPRQHVFGTELYKSIFIKASCYFYSFIKDHVFVNGNKRMGVAASIIFLDLNGYSVSAPNDSLVNYAKDIAQSRNNHKNDMKNIAEFFEKHSKKEPKNIYEFLKQFVPFKK